MSDDKSKKVKAYLYGEINRLRMHNSELYDDHCAELKTWTLKCGKMGNDIGSLRKQLAEKDELDATWTRRYERLQKQLSSKEAELQEVNEDLENAQWENMKLKKLLEKKERDDQIVIDKVIGEVEALRELMQQKEEEDINEETERPAGVMTVEVEIHSEPAGASISDEIIDLTSDIAEIIVEDVCERRDFGQINELEADGIVKTYYSSESDMDGEKKVSAIR